MEKLSPYEFEKAPEGSLFVKKGDKLVCISFEDVSKDLEKKCDGVLNIKQKSDANEKKLDKISRELQTLAKMQFISVFSLFELKAIKGEIEIDDEELLSLDEKVINNELSVTEALGKHQYLEETFKSLFGKAGK